MAAETSLMVLNAPLLPGTDARTYYELVNTMSHEFRYLPNAVIKEMDRPVMAKKAKVKYVSLFCFFSPVNPLAMLN